MPDATDRPASPHGDQSAVLSPEWLTVLLTEVSAAVHGHGNLNALTEAVRQVPEEYLEAAGLRWALSSFDDQAPTAEAIDTARDMLGDPTPRLHVTPREDNPYA